MKKLTLLVLFTILHSCDPQYCIEYDILNKTNKRLELISFNGGAKSRERTIGIGTYVGDLSLCDMNYYPPPKEEKFFYTSDSIHVKINDTLVKTYYYNVEDNGKNIYKKNNTEFWKLVEKGKHHITYVFEITEEDLK